MCAMDCPVCKEPMIVLEYDEVEVDYCVLCHGVWLDAGELDLLFGDRAITEGFLNSGNPRAAGGEAVRKCPICRKGMEKRVTGGAEPVVYDACPRDDGLWFDQGELGTVLKHGSDAAGGEEVGAWLRELFAKEPKDAGD